MKPSHAFLAAALLLSSCAAEFSIVESDVPVAVLQAFKEKYPAAENVAWEVEKKENRLVFEAEFKISGKETGAYFTTDGSLMKKGED